MRSVVAVGFARAETPFTRLKLGDFPSECVLEIIAPLSHHIGLLLERVEGEAGGSLTPAPCGDDDGSDDDERSDSPSPAYVELAQASPAGIRGEGLRLQLDHLGRRAALRAELGLGRDFVDARCHPPTLPHCAPSPKASDVAGADGGRGWEAAA